MKRNLNGRFNVLFIRVILDALSTDQVAAVENPTRRRYFPSLAGIGGIGLSFV